jgi:hypothetical protein
MTRQMLQLLTDRFVHLSPEDILQAAYWTIVASAAAWITLRWLVARLR